MNITYKGRPWRADLVILPGDLTGFGAGRIPHPTGAVIGVQMRVDGHTTTKAFGVVGRRMETGPMWKRVSKPSVHVLVAFFTAERNKRSLFAAITGG